MIHDFYFRILVVDLMRLLYCLKIVSENKYFSNADTGFLSLVELVPLVLINFSIDLYHRLHNTIDR
jgi:hypothetical protein